MTATHLFPSPLVGEGQGGGNLSTTRARELRKNATEAEKRLWYWLRRKNISNARFRMQVPLGSYIVDFACYDPKVIIELDGGQHTLQQGYDQRRDAWLKAQGFQVLRFWNNEVMGNVEGVLEVISKRINALKELPLPSPPPQGGRE